MSRPALGPNQWVAGALPPVVMRAAVRLMFTSYKAVVKNERRCTSTPKVSLPCTLQSSAKHRHCWTAQRSVHSCGCWHTVCCYNRWVKPGRTALGKAGLGSTCQQYAEREYGYT